MGRSRGLAAGDELVGSLGAQKSVAPSSHLPTRDRLAAAKVLRALSSAHYETPGRFVMAMVWLALGVLLTLLSPRPPPLQGLWLEMSAFLDTYSKS